MNIEECAQKAMDLKNHHGYNCCQAVTAALADETGLTEEQLNQISAGFCGGMGTMEATCGSLIGAGMVAGLKTGGQKTVQYTRQILENFKKLSGATVCRELKSAVNGKALCPCENCVKNAVLSYGAVMEKQDG